VNPRLLRTADFRLAAFYTALFAVSVAVLGVFVSWTTTSAIKQQFNGRIEAEIEELGTVFNSGGSAAVLETVRARSRGVHALDYLVRDTAGNRLAGDLPDPADVGWTELIAHEDAGDTETVRMLTRRFGDLTVSAGDDVMHVGRATKAITMALWSAFAVTVVLGIGGGVVLSRGFLRRVDAISRTADAIVNGDLARRVPDRGTDDDLDALARTVNRMLDRIAELMSGMRQVSSAVAHELRTPLTRLRQSLERALADRSPAALEGALQHGMVETDAILETFGALLRIAEVEAGTRRAGFREVDLATIAEQVVEAFAPSAEDQEKVLSLAISSRPRISGDRGLLTQLLANLVENGIRHTPPGTRIEVGLTTAPSGPRLTIGDTGPGVPAEQRHRIFDRFHRVDPSSGGLGLGLTLVKAIADLHGAHVHAEDNAPGLRIIVDFA
jgi:signal transduction histidine kinase